MSQFSNDTFPTAMHIATVLEFTHHLLPNVQSLAEHMAKKAFEWVDIVKIGRTHLQDATLLPLAKSGQGMSHNYRMRWNLSTIYAGTL